MNTVHTYCRFVNRAFRGAWLRGLHDAAGTPWQWHCPYPDRRRPDGRVTYSAVLRKAWSEGFQRWIEDHPHQPRPTLSEILEPQPAIPASLDLFQ